MDQVEKIAVKRIYVSPHSDDVALSCGGSILADPARQDGVIVLNMFTSERLTANRNNNQTEASFVDSISPVRKAEDRAAWQFGGVQADYADLPEALLRGAFPFALLSRHDNRQITDDIVQVIQNYADRYPAATFFFPAGIGNHVDHLACRNAAFRCLSKGILDRIMLYEDAPYSWLGFIRKQSYRDLLAKVVFAPRDLAQLFQYSGESIVSYLGRRNVPFPRGRALFLAVHAALMMRNAARTLSSRSKPFQGKVRITTLDQQVAAHKISLLYRYESQIPMLFGSDPMATLHRHTALLGREVVIEISRG